MQVLIDVQHKKFKQGSRLSGDDHAKLDEAEKLLHECLAARQNAQRRRQERELGVVARLFGTTVSGCRSALVGANMQRLGKLEQTRGILS